MAERADSLMEANESRRWVVGYIETPAGRVPRVPRVAARLTWRDWVGSLAVCWNFGRLSYR